MSRPLSVAARGAEALSAQWVYDAVHRSVSVGLLDQPDGPRPFVESMATGRFAASLAQTEPVALRAVQATHLGACGFKGSGSAFLAAGKPQEDAFVAVSRVGVNFILTQAHALSGFVHFDVDGAAASVLTGLVALRDNANSSGLFEHVTQGDLDETFSGLLQPGSYNFFVSGAVTSTAGLSHEPFGSSSIEYVFDFVLTPLQDPSTELTQPGTPAWRELAGLGALGYHLGVRSAA